jgi:hypothetical protein
LQEVDEVQENLEDDKDSEHNSDSLDGPDTSSFRAFFIKRMIRIDGFKQTIA